MDMPMGKVETVQSYRDREDQMSVHEESLFIADEVCLQEGDEFVFVGEYVEVDGTYARKWDFDVFTFFLEKIPGMEEFEHKFRHIIGDLMSEILSQYTKSEMIYLDSAR